MDEELISKKELLKLTNISYGQLYRWKRKNLIPEEWFIRKSTFTGQETFFPKDKIIDRINKIKDLKDDLSLDELANIFSEKVDFPSMQLNDLLKKQIISEKTLNFFETILEPNDILSFSQILTCYIINDLLEKSQITNDEARLAFEVLTSCQEGENRNSLFIARKIGVSFVVLGSSDIVFDRDSKVIVTVDLKQRTEELRLKLL